MLSIFFFEYRLSKNIKNNNSFQRDQFKSFISRVKCMSFQRDIIARVQDIQLLA